MIYHITTPDLLAQFSTDSHIGAASIASEGFIHCSTASQISGVLERYFGGIDEIIILSIDENLLEAELKYEIATDNEAFPHIFGQINKNAIVNLDSKKRNIDNIFII